MRGQLKAPCGRLRRCEVVEREVFSVAMKGMAFWKARARNFFVAVCGVAYDDWRESARFQRKWAISEEFGCQFGSLDEMGGNSGSLAAKFQLDSSSTPDRL